MPATRIDTRRGWIGSRRPEMLSALQRALEAGLKIPAHDRCIVLQEHEPDSFLVPPGVGPNYMVVEIVLFNGRSLDAKRRLYSEIVTEMRAFGLGPSDVKTVLVESTRENWGLRGKAACDIDLGFKVEV